MNYRTHLAKADPVMRMLVKKHPLKRIRIAKNPLEHLVGAIISQQLSVKAADTIENRFLALFAASPRRSAPWTRGRGKFPSAERILKTPISRIRSCGISGSKTRYIKNVARAFTAGHLDRAHLMRMGDDEVRERVIAIKGVGPWTAEMFLIFALARPDVFSPGDLGLRNAIQRLYRRRPTPALMARLSRAWSPYRSYACRLLWNSIDNA
jgi:DNA-3-methyladenine glycosylase II